MVVPILGPQYKNLITWVDPEPFSQMCYVNTNLNLLKRVEEVYVMYWGQVSSCILKSNSRSDSVSCYILRQGPGAGNSSLGGQF